MSSCKPKRRSDQRKGTIKDIEGKPKDLFR
jgi:hypothetical protein